MSRWEIVADQWPDRLELAAALIPAGSRVIDLGAGAQGLRDHLPEGCTYTPADLFRRSPDTLAFDADRGIWPEGRWDVAVLLGLLEFVPVQATLRGAKVIAPLAVVSYWHAQSRVRRLTEDQFAEICRRIGWQAEIRGDFRGHTRTGDISPRGQRIWLLSA